MGIHGKKPEDWSCEICKLAKSYKQISRDTPFRLAEACAELHTDMIPVKPQGLGGFNHFITIIDSATMYTGVTVRDTGSQQSGERSFRGRASVAGLVMQRHCCHGTNLYVMILLRD